MDFDEYQTHAMRTANVELGERDKIAMAALGVAGEAGEVADYLKKVLFHGHKMDRDKLRKELGDVLWYVAVLARLYHLPLEEVAEANVIKLRARYPEGFLTADSIRRADGEINDQDVD